MSGPATNSIQDTLYDPEGNLLNGTITISNPTTFVSNDGFTILQGYTQTIQIVDGVLDIDLIISPTVGSPPEPSGQQYLVTHQLTDLQFQENWVVPASPDPCTLADVRVS